MTKRWLNALGLGAVMAMSVPALADGGADDVTGAPKDPTIAAAATPRVNISMHQNLDVSEVDGDLKIALDKIPEANRASVLRSAEMLADLASQRWLYKDDAQSPIWAELESMQGGKELTQAIAKHIEPYATKKGATVFADENPFVERTGLLTFIVNYFDENKSLQPMATMAVGKYGDYHFDRNFGDANPAPVDGTGVDLNSNSTVDWEDQRIIDIVNASGKVGTDAKGNVKVSGLNSAVPGFSYVDLPGVSLDDAQKLVEKLGNKTAQVTEVDVSGTKTTRVLICNYTVDASGNLATVFDNAQSYLSAQDGLSNLDIKKLATDAGIDLSKSGLKLDTPLTVEADETLNTALVQECVEDYLSSHYAANFLESGFDYKKISSLNYKNNGDLEITLQSAELLHGTGDAMPVLTLEKNAITADVLTQDALDVIVSGAIKMHEGNDRPIKIFAEADAQGEQEFAAIFAAFASKGVTLDQLDATTQERAEKAALPGTKAAAAAPGGTTGTPGTGTGTTGTAGTTGAAGGGTVKKAGGGAGPGAGPN